MSCTNWLTNKGGSVYLMVLTLFYLQTGTREKKKQCLANPVF